MHGVPQKYRHRGHVVVLPVTLTKERDGRWSADVPLLVGCTTWGRTWKDAFTHAKEAVEGYVAVLLENGRNIPTSSKVPRGPVIVLDV